MNEDDARHYPLPVELRSVYLHNAIYNLDSYVVNLEEKVERLEGEVKVLQKEKPERSSQMLQDAQSKVGMQLSQILAFANSEPPVSLDAVLILKHLEGLVREVREEGMWHDEFFDKVERYLEGCMQKAAQEAKELPAGDSNEPGER